MILFILLLASTGVVLGGEPAAKAETPEKALSNTSAASCLVNITFDPAVLPLTVNTVDSLIRSSGVAGIAAREVFPGGDYTNSVERLDYVMDVPLPEKNGTIMAELQVVLKTETKPAAEEFLRLIILNLKGALEQAAEENCKRLQDNLHRAAMVQVDSNRALRQTRERIGELQKKVGRSDVSWDGMFREVERLEKEKQSLEMERAGREARRAALERAVHGTSEQARVQIASDAVIAELERLVLLLEEQVKAMKEIRDKGRVSEQDLTDLQIRLAEAKGRLAARREAVLQAAGGDLLAKLNAELTMLSIDAAECDARLKAIEEQLGKAKDPERFKVANEFADLKEEEAQLSDQARFARRLFEEQRSRLINLRPVTVTVLGGI